LRPTSRRCWLRRSHPGRWSCSTGWGLGAHRTERVKELVEERGADLLFLPSYSPDLNPIEQAFSKIKNIVRKAGARTREALEEAISEAIEAVTLEDAASWFAHCGYRPQDQPL
jgi:DDE superfamily endonuclease